MAENVPELKHNESAVIKLSGVPELGENGNSYLVGIVELDGDQEQSNNETEPLEVIIDTREAFNVKVTNDKMLSESTHTPMQFYSPYSACQTIYNPEMLSVVDKDGNESLFISRLAYDYTSDRDITDVKVKVYLGQTTANSFPELNKTWIETNQTLVFDGVVDITKGKGVLCITLDERFEFDPTMSLVVTVLKECFAVAGEFPVHFITFDGNIQSPEYHSMRYNDINREFSMDDTSEFSSNSFVDHNAPVLYIAIPGAVGVASPAAGALSGIHYADGHIFFGAIDAKQVAVWSVDGKLVKNVAPAKGATSVAFDVMPGVYVVKVTSAEGDVYTVKVNATR